MTVTDLDDATWRVTPPEDGGIGAEVVGVDGLFRGGGLDADRVDALKGLIYRHKLVALRGMRLSPAEYVEFARRFGRIEPYHQENYHHPDHPEIFVSSNVPMDGKKVGVAGTGQFWHTDYSFMPEPLSFTFVYPQIIPKTRRETYYVDMARALRELPDDLRSYVEEGEPRRAFHDATHYYKVRPEDVDRPLVELVAKFRAMSPGCWHPLVLRHPVTDEEILYLSSGFTTALEGLSIRENKDVLPRFFHHVQEKARVHKHAWKPGDLLMWDNRGLNHHASKPGGGQASQSFRISLYDGLPFYTNPIDRPLPDDVYRGDYLATCR